MSAVAFAAALSACAMSDESMSRLLVAPDKFSLYTCPELAVQGTKTAAREHELEALMAKAGPESGGRLVSSVAYKPEYLELRGEMTELRKTAVAKDCKFSSSEANLGGLTNNDAAR